MWPFRRKVASAKGTYEHPGTKRSGAHKAHNHPSGVAEPSQADEIITQRLKAALDLVDIRLLDHIVTAGDSCISFAERGLL